MKKLFTGALASLVLFGAASSAYAQTLPTPTPQPKPDTLSFRIEALLSFVDLYVVPIIFALAFIVFLWFVFQYFILGGADEEKLKTGRKFVLWSLIGFFLMFSLWGIVNLIQRSLGFENGTKPPVPTFNSGG